MTAPAGYIPFLDIGNKYLQAGDLPPYGPSSCRG